MNYILHVTTVHVHVHVLTTVPLPTCTVQPWTSSYLQYMQDLYMYSTVHELSSSIQLEVSYVFIVGKFAQVGSVCFSSY